MRVNRNLRSFWRRFIGQLGTLLLSIVMGLIVWLIAINQENPLVTSVSEPVTVQIRGLAPNLTILNPGERVGVELQGPRLTWESFDSNTAITATVDLSNLGPGVHYAPIRIEVNNPEMSPTSGQTLEVNLETVITKTLPVQVEIMDSPAYGYNALPPIVDPPSVAVVGPATRMQRVDGVRSQVYLRGAQDQVVRNQPPDAVDSSKQIVGSVAITPTNITITVPIAAWPGRKQVGVRVDLEGQAADGFRLGQVKVNPTNVVLIGNSDALSGISVIESEPVSVEGATRDIQTRVRLLLPTNVTAFEGETVDVVIGIVPVEASSRTTLRPTIRGLGPGLKATVGLDTVDVIMSGPKSILDALASDDVFVILDLNNRLAGTHVLTPQVVIPDDIRLEGVLPDTVEVVITNVASAAVTATLPSSSTLAVTATLTVTPTNVTPTATLTGAQRGVLPAGTVTSTTTSSISATPQVTRSPTPTGLPSSVPTDTPVDTPTRAATPTRTILRPTPATLRSSTVTATRPSP